MQQQQLTATTCPEYNHDVLDPIVDYVQLILKVGIILGLILDLVCYKHRNVANVFLYWESSWHLLLLLVPTKYYIELEIVNLAIFHFMYFLCLYTNQGS